MQIIKDKQLIEDNWDFIADDTPITTGNISISIDRWQTEKQALMNRDGLLGVRLNSETDITEIIADLANFQLIEVNFPAFTDGRAFTQAKLLRSRYDYQGEIRAVGHFMRDQVYYLGQVGVNAFNPTDWQDLSGAIKSLDDFSVSYQTLSLDK